MATELVLATTYVSENDVVDVKDLILHEIAHALVGCAHGHDYVWKANCVEIGSKPEQYAKLDASKIVHTHEVSCAKCSMVYKKLFAASRKYYSRYTCKCGSVGSIRCVTFWGSVVEMAVKKGASAAAKKGTSL